MHSRVRKKAVTLAILAGIAFLIFLFGLSESLVLRFYSEGLYPYLSALLRFLSSIFPFALGDFLYALLIGFCLWSVIKAIKRLRKRQGIDSPLLLPLQLMNFLLVLYIIFKLLWGLNYSRPSVSERLGIDDGKYTAKQLAELGEFLIVRLNKVNTERNRLQVHQSYTIDQLRDTCVRAYATLAKKNAFFHYRVPSVKPVMFSWIVTKIGIEGYYCPLSGEANVNMMLPHMELPFVTAHEISHTLGVAREDEANLAGYLVCINSSNLNFQYSGYYNILRSVLFELRMKSPDEFTRLLKTVNAGTLRDFKAEQDFWRKYNGDMSAYMNVALDNFLKMNNQKKGTESYQDIVLWVYNLHKQDLPKTLQP